MASQALASSAYTLPIVHDKTTPVIPATAPAGGYDLAPATGMKYGVPPPPVEGVIGNDSRKWTFGAGW